MKIKYIGEASAESIKNLVKDFAHLNNSASIANYINSKSYDFDLVVISKDNHRNLNLLGLTALRGEAFAGKNVIIHSESSKLTKMLTRQISKNDNSNIELVESLSQLKDSISNKLPDEKLPSKETKVDKVIVTEIAEEKIQKKELNLKPKTSDKKLENNDNNFVNNLDKIVNKLTTDNENPIKHEEILSDKTKDPENKKPTPDSIAKALTKKNEPINHYYSITSIDNKKPNKFNKKSPSITDAILEIKNNSRKKSTVTDLKLITKREDKRQNVYMQFKVGVTQQEFLLASKNSSSLKNFLKEALLEVAQATSDSEKVDLINNTTNITTNGAPTNEIFEMMIKESLLLQVWGKDRSR